MAVTPFADGIETGLNNIQGDILAKSPTIDDDVPSLEDCQLLAVAYTLVRALRARKNSANDRDRVFGRAGGTTQIALQPLVSMIEEVYREFVLAANGVDDPTDSPFEVGYCDTVGGPQGGPTH